MLYSFSLNSCFGSHTPIFHTPASQTKAFYLDPLCGKKEKSHLMPWIGKRNPPQQCVCLYTHTTRLNKQTIQKASVLINLPSCFSLSLLLLLVSSSSSQKISLRAWCMFRMVYWTKTLTSIYCFYLLTINRF